MKEQKEKRDYGKAGLATLLLFIFLVVCVILDYQETRSHYLLWLCFEKDFLSIHWLKNPSSYLLRISLPLSMPLDTMVPLIPLTIVIVYIGKMGQYLKLNPSHFRGHRVHHYHVGILITLVGIILTTLKTGVVPFLLNGKETTPTEVSQSLGLCFLIAGIIFIIFDSKDLRNRKPRHSELFLKCWQHNFRWTPAFLDALAKDRRGRRGLKLLLSCGIRYSERLIQECQNHYNYDLRRMIIDVRSGGKIVAPFAPPLLDKLLRFVR